MFCLCLFRLASYRSGVIVKDSSVVLATAVLIISKELLFKEYEYKIKTKNYDNLKARYCKYNISAAHTPVI
jgi:hypothetical protein